MVFHEALDPKDFDSDDSLKEACFDIIQKQLDLDNPVTPSQTLKK